MRDVSKDDATDLARVWSIVYRRGEPFPADEEVLDPGDLGFVAESNGSLVGGFAVTSLHVTRGQASLRCGGVAGVGVLPEARHRQVGTEMMRWSLHEMRARGYDLGALYAFSDVFYRRVGYEVTGRRWLITCPSARLPRVKPTLPVRHLSSEDSHLLDHAYRAFAHAHSGVHLRTREDWIDRFGKKPPMIYAVGDPVEAYAWVSMEGGFWEDLRVGEFAWSTRAGYESMLAVLTGLCINRTALLWHEPSDGPFLSRFMDQGIKIAMDRHIMFRVLDVPRAFTRLQPEDSGEFTFEVEDEEMPENRGPWHVKFDPHDGVQISPTSKADLRMSERALAQAFMGEPSLSILLQNADATCQTDVAARNAALLLTPRSTVCMDFF